MIYKKLRSDLQTRKNRVFRADDNATFILELRGFFDFMNRKPILKGLMQELDIGKPEFTKTNALELASKIPDLEIQRIRHCIAVLNYSSSIEDESFFQFYMQLGLRIRGPSRSGDFRTAAFNLFRDTFFLPFYEYLDEHIEDYGIILYLLQRFKFRTETFDRDNMYQLYKSHSEISESLLDKQVRKYLFDQGVEYPLSTPLSASGRSDIVAELHTEDPLVLEIKILDLDRGYDRSYIRKGFKQIFDYTNDYNKSVGYLLILNASEIDLNFNLKSKFETKIELNGKTFYIVVVDIYPDTVPSSRKGKLKPYTIEESFLVSIEESGVEGP
jgi:hypothetical protein